jgi:hypothetical protein
MGNSDSHPTPLYFTLISNKRAADILLREAEQKDMYLEECHDDRSNALARKQMTYTANSISPQEAELYRAILHKTLPQIPVRLRMDLQEIQIISLMPTADGGMPHTRPPNLICFPNLSQISSLSTMIHELWHVHQRMYPALWITVFEKMGWKPWNGAIPSSIERNRRFNPDTLDHPLWIYQNQWIPVPIFKDISRPSVDQVDIWFYQPYEQYHVKSVPPELKAAFPTAPPSAYEHPRELTAYVLAEPDRYKSSPGFHTLLQAVGQLSIQSD